MAIRAENVLTIPGAIDTHLHPWRLDDLPPVIQGARHVRPDLAQDFSPERVVLTAVGSGFSGVLLVHARDAHEGSRGEADFFIAAAAERPEVLGCIVGVDLLDPVGTEAMLESLGNNPLVRGARMIAPENHGVGILSDVRARTTARLLGERGVRLDLLVRSSNPGQLREAVELVRWLADNSTTVVIGDHLLKPLGVGEGQPQEDWCTALSELALCGDFFMKLSGLPGEVPQGSSAKTFYPFYDTALEVLGAQRLLFGSDHPVSYGHWESVEAVLGWLEDRGLINGQIPEQIFSRNARLAYGL
jgi:L-fuconolactonase